MKLDDIMNAIELDAHGHGNPQTQHILREAAKSYALLLEAREAGYLVECVANGCKYAFTADQKDYVEYLIERSKEFKGAKVTKLYTNTLEKDLNR